MVTDFETSLASTPNLAVFERLEDARDHWRELFSRAAATPYQNYDYVAGWFETIGERAAVAPMIVVVYDPEGRPIVLLPLCVRDVHGFRVAEFLGGRESNFNMALSKSGAAFDLQHLLVDAARRQATPPDLYYLRNQPRAFAGVRNPLIEAFSRLSPSFAYGSRLPADLATLEERFSKKSQKKIGGKIRRLSALGALTFEHDARDSRRREILSALVEQKASRLAEMRIGGFDPREMKAFLVRVNEAGPLEAHALSVSGRIVATYVGLADGDRFCALMNSYDLDPLLARFSPCQILLHGLLKNLVARGFTHFDLGVGEADYKSAVCDETIELYDTILAVTARGALAAPLLRNFIAAKRLIKQTPALMRVLEWSRRCGSP